MNSGVWQINFFWDGAHESINQTSTKIAALLNHLSGFASAFHFWTSSNNELAITIDGTQANILVALTAGQEEVQIGDHHGTVFKQTFLTNAHPRVSLRIRAGMSITSVPELSLNSIQLTFQDLPEVVARQTHFFVDLIRSMAMTLHPLWGLVTRRHGGLVYPRSAAQLAGPGVSWINFYSKGLALPQPLSSHAKIITINGLGDIVIVEEYPFSVFSDIHDALFREATQAFAGKWLAALRTP